MVQPITLTVNGTVHEIEVDPKQSLLHVLRDTLGLTGSKIGALKAVWGMYRAR